MEKMDEWIGWVFVGLVVGFWTGDLGVSLP